MVVVFDFGFDSAHIRRSRSQKNMMYRVLSRDILLRLFGGVVNFGLSCVRVCVFVCVSMYADV